MASPFGGKPLAPLESSAQGEQEEESDFYEHVAKRARLHAPSSRSGSFQSSPFASLGEAVARDEDSRPSPFGRTDALSAGAAGLSSSPSTTIAPLLPSQESVSGTRSPSLTRASPFGVNEPMRSTFGATAQPKLSSFASFGKPAGPGTPASFASFGRTSAEFGPSTSFRTMKMTPRDLQPSSGTQKSTSPAQILEGDDILAKAMQRAMQKRKAVFGHEDVAADKAVGEYLTRLGAPNVSTLASELSAVASQHPVAMDFIRHIFKNNVQSSTPALPGMNDASPHSRSVSQRIPPSYFEANQRTSTDHSFFLPTKKSEARLAQLRKGNLDFTTDGRRESSADKSAPCNCSERNETKTLPDTENGEDNPPFLVLDLPPELRMEVLKSALNPGFISLRSCAHHLPAGTFPEVSPALLQTSKQIRHEAKDLLLENTLIVNVWVDCSSRSVVNPHQLPRHLHPSIKHLTIVIDFTPIITSSATERDWRPFQRMTNLKTLRICAINGITKTSGSSVRRDDIYQGCVKAVVERVPKDCIVSYGPDAPAEEAHIADMTKALNKHGKTHAGLGYGGRCGGCYCMPGEVILGHFRELEKVEKVVQGCKSGSALDWRFIKEEREDTG
ncbi:unnamed protein product [Zymoseptoria tritici ST99CH_1E4]|uniref:Uncharacterized protein n=1 Tax=Zymoseptoria tritici ST99CH_1E4 TaxID=1276532 RepID=A0A2H1H3S0_ZYMTR|nr:unnamed protein product [Zymoseptoria tritici ST99CH_1E4]